MKNTTLIDSLRGKLVVSCQALENEPLYGSQIMAKMALAACQGGASAIRANTPQDIFAIKKEVAVPVIGLYKVNYPDSDIYITPTVREVDALMEVGAEIIAFDFTNRLRPKGVMPVEFFAELKKKYPTQIFMADISTYEEGIQAQMAGVDLVSTTLSGYTSYSPRVPGPDFELVERLAKELSIPLMAEGRITTPDEMKQAFSLGAHTVIIGGAITRPVEITRRFTTHLSADNPVK